MSRGDLGAVTDKFSRHICKNQTARGGESQLSLFWNGSHKREKRRERRGNSCTTRAEWMKWEWVRAEHLLLGGARVQSELTGVSPQSLNTRSISPAAPTEQHTQEFCGFKETLCQLDSERGRRGSRNIWCGHRHHPADDLCHIQMSMW